MALIDSYTLTPRALSFEAQYSIKSYAAFVKENGGFDAKKKKVTPLKWSNDNSFEVHDYLDSLTGAVEAGLVDDEKWPTQLFASKQDLAEFVAALSNYDEFWRITDRWYQALGLLGDFDDTGEGIISCESMADEIWRHAIEDLGAFKEAATPKAAAKKVAAKKAPVKAATKRKAKA